MPAWHDLRGSRPAGRRAGRAAGLSQTRL